MIIKNDIQKETLLTAGMRLREVLDAIAKKIAPGVMPKDLDTYAYELITKQGDTPSFLNYRPSNMKEPFPSTICLSTNNQIVHSAAQKNTTMLREGDVVSIDCGLEHKGLFVDAACTVIVGEGDDDAKKLVEATKKALAYALVFARVGNTVGDVGNAIETVAYEHELTIPAELGGHGVGEAVHEEPFIPNMGNPGEGEYFKENQVVAIEPIFTEGEDPRVKLEKNGFAYETFDNSRSAHFEHTLIITKQTPIIVTGSLW